MRECFPACTGVFCVTARRLLVRLSPWRVAKVIFVASFPALWKRLLTMVLVPCHRCFARPIPRAATPVCPCVCERLCMDLSRCPPKVCACLCQPHHHDDDEHAPPPQLQRRHINKATHYDHSTHNKSTLTTPLAARTCSTHNAANLHNINLSTRNTINLYSTNLASAFLFPGQLLSKPLLVHGGIRGSDKGSDLLIF